MPERLGGCLKTGCAPSLQGNSAFLGWISDIMSSRTWADRVHWFRDYLLGYSKCTAEWKASGRSAAEVWLRAICCTELWPGCACSSRKSQQCLHHLQRASGNPPETAVKGQKFLVWTQQLIVITFPSLWKCCLVMWLSCWGEKLGLNFCWVPCVQKAQNVKPLQGFVRSHCF